MGQGGGRDAELIGKGVDVDRLEGGRVMRVVAGWRGDGSRGVTGLLHIRPNPKRGVWSRVEP